MNEHIINFVIKGDCLEEMNRIAPESIDLIICDLPYGTTQNEWDTIIPLTQLWKQYKRVIKPNGAIVLFGQDKFTAKVMMSNEIDHKYNLIWEKDRTSGFLNANRMPLKSHEDIMVFYSEQPTYNPQFWEGKPLHGRGTAYKTKEITNNNYGDYNHANEDYDDREGTTQKYPRSVLKFSRPHPPIHPTQKPVDLIEYLIKTFTNEGETVLDNCMGSHTTAIASINTGRNFIGMELNEEYHQMGYERIKEHILFNKNILLDWENLLECNERSQIPLGTFQIQHKVVQTEPYKKKTTKPKVNIRGSSFEGLL